MGDLTGKVAVITGAGRGLGREEAIQLARQGARVVINDIGLPEAKAAAESAVEEIKGFGVVKLRNCQKVEARWQAALERHLGRA